MANTSKKERCWICNRLFPKGKTKSYHLYIHSIDGKRTAYNHGFSACEGCASTDYTHLIDLCGFYALGSGNSVQGLLWTDKLIARATPH